LAAIYLIIKIDTLQTIQLLVYKLKEN